MTVFKTGDFTLASGKKSTWKIDCDGLTEEDWGTLAHIATPLLPPFGYVLGIPRGGVLFAKTMRHYRTMGSNLVLIVDDVYTTGGSLRWMVDSFQSDIQWHYICAFSRAGILPDNCTAIFACTG